MTVRLELKQRWWDCYSDAALEVCLGWAVEEAMSLVAMAGWLLTGSVYHCSGASISSHTAALPPITGARLLPLQFFNT